MAMILDMREFGMEGGVRGRGMLGKGFPEPDWALRPSYTDGGPVRTMLQRIFGPQRVDLKSGAPRAQIGPADDRLLVVRLVDHHLQAGDRRA